MKKKSHLCIVVGLTKHVCLIVCIWDMMVYLKFPGLVPLPEDVSILFSHVHLWVFQVISFPLIKLTVQNQDFEWSAEYLTERDQLYNTENEGELKVKLTRKSSDLQI